MILLEQTHDISGAAADHRRLVVLFGVGLIGSAIAAQLCRQGMFRQSRFAFSWTDADERRSDIEAIRASVLERASAAPAESFSVNVVWAAGKAGFGAPQSDVDAEFEPFEDVIGLARDLVAVDRSSQPSFHLVSSAGGLFEGQVSVNQQTKPKPLRPYGTAKLRQEQELLANEEFLRPMIYRPSSVYGYSKDSRRVGLVSALLGSSIRNELGVIFGAPSTLRDYILAEDIGAFVARRIWSGDLSGSPFLLASGKPTSMLEIIRRIELAVSRKVGVRYVLGDTNTLDNSFMPSALPDDLDNTPLDTGIRLIATRMLEALVVDPSPQR